MSARRIRTRDAVVIALTTFALGLVVRGYWAASDEQTTALSRSATRTGPGPTATRFGIPVGFDRSEAGARAAASAYVTSGQALLDLAPTEVPAAIAVMASGETREVQTSESQEQLAALRDLLADGSGPTRYVQAVLATRVEAFREDRARVSVWSVGILWRRGAASPQAGWTMSEFELIWESGDWKIWSGTITSGPNPAANGGAAPVSAEDLDRVLAGFDTGGTR